MWNDATNAWEEEQPSEDGFTAIVAESGDAQAEISRVAQICPLAAERVLALCAGKISAGAWHDVARLDSCVIDESEVICRLTFCQDSTARASEFRTARLKRCRQLWNILNQAAHLPPSLADLKDGFRLEWSRAFPDQNVVSTDGRRATVIYMGEDATVAQVDQVARTAREQLRRAIVDPDENLAARDRVAVWHRDNGAVALHDARQYARIDQVRDASEFDIGREA